ncbi:hypothetical protein P0Y35_14830 [Kiritimatiellaeota bacterium B1221]|nr:hypothetical protein [Kiritimatiellaeota bacterium B1221]
MSPPLPNRNGFTFAEILAAMLFLAVLVPVLSQAVGLASRLSSASVRREAAVRIAENLLEEAVATGEWHSSDNTDEITENGTTYTWERINTVWTESGMNAVTVTVTFPLQGQEQQVELSTLVEDES